MSERFAKGQRLYCRVCHSEIEIINPCTCDPPDQVFRCCGQDMTPNQGAEGHLHEAESNA